jgi:hypothetical protein
MAVVTLSSLAFVMADKIDLDQTDTSLNKAARYQDRLAEDVSTVPVASGCGFLGHIECSTGGRGENHVERTGIIGNQVSAGGRVSQVAQPLLDRLEE